MSSGEKTCVNHLWQWSKCEKSFVLHAKVHQRASTTEETPTNRFISAILCWHNGLKKRVALGYAWVQQLGLSFSKVDLATGTVKGSTNKQRPNLSPEYDKITQGV